MRNIQEFPDELLLNIFRLGCDDVDLEQAEQRNLWKPRYFQPRRRKPFIAAARSVCYLWHQLLNLQHLPYRNHFWFARLSLSLSNGWPYTSSKVVEDPKVIRDRLHQIRTILSASKGCDLLVELDGEIMGRNKVHANPLALYDSTSPEQQLSIKLFLHGISEILQYRCQILGISVLMNYAPLQKHLAEFFADCRQTPRLQSMHIGFSQTQFSPQAYSYSNLIPDSDSDSDSEAEPDPLRNLASSPCIPGSAKAYLPALNLQNHHQLSPVKLAHTGTLSIPSPYLLNFAYQITAEHLIIGMDHHSKDEHFIFTTTILQSPLCTNLRELTLKCTSSTEPAELEIQEKVVILSFPQLQSLHVDNADDIHIYMLLQQMDCPQLIRATLVVVSYPHFLTRSRWAVTNQNRFPRLAKLNMAFRDQSLGSLYLLDAFKDSPVKQLGLKQVLSTDMFLIPTSSSVETAMNILPNFKPEGLQLHDWPWAYIFLLLGELKCCNLHDVDLRIYDSPEFSDNPSHFEPGWVPQVIDLPFLSTCTLKFSQHKRASSWLLEMFQYINMEALEHLEISPVDNIDKGRQSPWDKLLRTQEKENPIPLLAALYSVTLYFHVEAHEYEMAAHNPILLKLWQMSPNLAVVKLDVDVNVIASTRFTLPDLCKRLFCNFASLDPICGPSILLPLRTLSHLDVTCRVKRIQGHFDKDTGPTPVPGVRPYRHIRRFWPWGHDESLPLRDATDHEIETARIATVERLALRHVKGAINLQLVKLVYEHHHRTRGPGMLKFCAEVNTLPVMEDMGDHTPFRKLLRTVRYHHTPI
jgi:hypothetical protein